jgi:hypothetical protein
VSASVCKVGCISERVLSIGSRQGIRDGLEGQHDWERIVRQSDSAETLVPGSGALVLGSIARATPPPQLRPTTLACRRRAGVRRPTRFPGTSLLPTVRDGIRALYIGRTRELCTVIPW